MSRMKERYTSLVDNLKFTDTFLLEILCIWQALFYFPMIIRTCEIQEDILMYLYYGSALMGVWSLIKNKIQLRHLHVLYFLISNMSFIIVNIQRNVYHPEHFYSVLIYFVISIYLTWRIGKEKMHKWRMKNG